MSGIRPFPAWTDLQVGDELPVFELKLTATMIVAGAIASRDFMPVHHDRSYAQAQGAPDIFANIFTTNGYVSRYITDWAGPDVMLKKISIRLGVPALPGDTLRFTGTIIRTAIDRNDSVVDSAVTSGPGIGLVEVQITVATPLGNHVTGSVEFTLPG